MRSFLSPLCRPFASVASSSWRFLLNGLAWLIAAVCAASTIAATIGGAGVGLLVGCARAVPVMAMWALRCGLSGLLYGSAGPAGRPGGVASPGSCCEETARMKCF
jgi:hypothetical protein